MHGTPTPQCLLSLTLRFRDFEPSTCVVLVEARGALITSTTVPVSLLCCVQWLGSTACLCFTVLNLQHIVLLDCLKRLVHSTTVPFPPTLLYLIVWPLFSCAQWLGSTAGGSGESRRSPGVI